MDNILIILCKKKKKSEPQQSTLFGVGSIFIEWEF